MAGEHAPPGLPTPPIAPIIDAIRNADVAPPWRLFFAQLANYLASVQMRGLRADQPAATATWPGSTYYVEDEDVLEWSDGVNWFADAIGSVIVAVAGGLGGDGTAGDPLYVRVDGTTIEINGSNNLQQTDGIVAAGTYGSASLVPRVTLDTYGRVTAVSQVTIVPTTGFAPMSDGANPPTIVDNGAGEFVMVPYTP